MVRIALAPEGNIAMAAPVLGHGTAFPAAAGKPRPFQVLFAGFFAIVDRFRNARGASQWHAVDLFIRSRILIRDHGRDGLDLLDRNFLRERVPGPQNRHPHKKDPEPCW